jgi:hypothetical protein
MQNVSWIQKHKLTEAEARVLRVRKLEEKLNEIYKDGIKPVWTPLELAESMLKEIDVCDRDILVVSDLGFMLPLKDKGADFSRVWFISHDAAQSALARSIGIQDDHVLEFGYNDPIEKLERLLVGLKFDIVVGNPPYQGKTPGQKLWMAFLRLIVGMSPRETLLVTPSMWINRDLTQAQKVRDLVANLGLKSVQRCDESPDGRPYFNVGESVCWYHLGRSDSYTVDGQLVNSPYAAEIISVSNDERMAQCIIDKVRAKKLGKDKTGVRWTLANPQEMGEKYSKEETYTHKNLVMHTASQWYFTSEDTSSFQGPKLLINISGHYKNSQKYILTHEKAVAGNGARQIGFSSHREASIARSLFVSDLYVFCVNAKKSGGFNDIGFLPVIQSDTEWTPAMVYGEFDIGQNEQDFISQWLIQKKLV